MPTVDDNKPNDPVRIRDDTREVENHNARPPGVAIDTIVVHADAAARAASSVNWIKNNESDVSYHTLVERDGDVRHLVPPRRRAWHAGKSAFKGRGDVNDFSLGLAFANRNDGVEEYTELQYQIGAAVVALWMREFPAITMDRITDHATVALPKGRKTDPGPRFDMKKFKEYVGKTSKAVHVDG